MQKQVAILGAGPIGIEAAVYGLALGHGVTLYERGPTAAANVGDWGHVHLFTPWRMNTTPLGVETLRRHGRWPEFPGDVCPSGDELRQHYLLPLTETEPLSDCLRADTSVLKVGRERHHKGDAIGKPDRSGDRFRLLVETHDGRQRVDPADVVLDCTGTYGHHRWCGRGGIPAPGENRLEDHIDYTLPDPTGHDRARFADRHSLLLGCGYSAATFLKDVEHLRRDHGRTRVTWAIRKPGLALRQVESDPLPARRHLVEASLRLANDPPEWLTFVGDAAVELIQYREGQFDVSLSAAATRGQVTCDNVVALVGYSPDTGIYDQLQVHSCYATAGPMKLAAALLGETGQDCLSAGAALGPETLKNPEPDFYILGAKSYGTNSNFLLQVGHQQIRDVFRLIGPPTPDGTVVDLYAAAR